MCGRRVLDRGRRGVSRPWSWSCRPAAVVDVTSCCLRTPRARPRGCWPPRFVRRLDAGARARRVATRSVTAGRGGDAAHSQHDGKARRRRDDRSACPSHHATPTRLTPVVSFLLSETNGENTPRRWSRVWRIGPQPGKIPRIPRAVPHNSGGVYVLGQMTVLRRGAGLSIRRSRSRSGPRRPTGRSGGDAVPVRGDRPTTPARCPSSTRSRIRHRRDRLRPGRR